MTYPQCPPSPDHSCLGAHPLCYPACRPLPRHRSFYLWPIHSFSITQHSFSHSLRFISSTLFCPFLPVHFHHPSGLSLIICLVLESFTSWLFIHYTHIPCFFLSLCLWLIHLDKLPITLWGLFENIFPRTYFLMTSPPPNSLVFPS